MTEYASHNISECIIFEFDLSPPWLSNTDLKRQRSITPD